MLEECYELYLKKNELDQSMSEKLEQIKLKSDELSASTSREQQLVRQINLQNEKIEKLNRQQEARRNLLSESMNSVKSEYETIKRERIQIQEKIDKNEMFIKETDKKVIRNAWLLI